MDSEKLRAPGVAMTLADGKEHQLIFDMESYALLEEELGDLAIFVDRTMPKFKAYRVRNVALGMHAALLHEEDPRDPSTRRTRKEIYRLCDFKKISAYILALLDAFTQGMPDITSSPNPNGSGADSPGNDSTTSQQSASAAATESSGG